IHIGGLSLKTFGLMFALAFLAIGALIARRFKELDKPVDWAYEITFAALLGGLVGSRLYFIVQNYDDVKGDLLGNLFSGAGLVWYGGAIGGTLGVLAWGWWRGFFGCQVSGDGDYGKAWGGPWAMAYPDGTVPTNQDVHPTPIYETLVMGLVALL